MSIFQSSKALNDWFKIIASAYADTDPDTVREYRDFENAFYSLDGELDGQKLVRGNVQDDGRLLEVLDRTLKVFERWGLIEARADYRETPRIRLRTTTRVGILTSRGRKLAASSERHRIFYFLLRTMASRFAVGWRVLMAVIAAGGAVLTVSRFILEWGTIPAAVATAIAAVVALLASQN